MCNTIILLYALFSIGSETTNRMMAEADEATEADDDSEVFDGSRHVSASGWSSLSSGFVQLKQTSMLLLQ